MIAAVVILLVSIIPAIMLAEAIARRRRLADWKKGRVSVEDDQFLAEVADIRASREAVLRVREEIAHATQLPTGLITAKDRIEVLERVGRPTHSSVLDYFTDLLPVDDPKDESRLVTVRDFVIEFAKQLK